ncbi:right-handed parallel beta-helix repeat-containing protein [Arthrobacter sp. I2-34]|uniref:Right-handed parallel beta-helix repeat-containing protein n=1 Tax=Arthrobacter hankyongi TaxID=2904801 RepID=A0ABS9L1M4_9MICC|nr:right-handed parallel beta-helix repeat-containing protein [Arthrobacter hankyongi]MCG2620551.1 right-handed parallel beta-helix repeat-containing protein [Arthrobacter hankyongi]
MTDGSTARRRPARQVAAAAALAMVLLGVPFALAAADREAPAAVSTPAAVAAEALVVAPGGSDDAAGSAAAPLKTVGAAVDRAVSGQTILLRAGSYHESVTIPPGKQLSIRSYPGEKAWFDGSVPVTDFASQGSTYVAEGWTAEFDASPTYTKGAPDGTSPGWQFVNEEHPMAAHPDQVWIDGEPQQQVGSLSEVKAGTFYVDYAGDRLFLGSNPEGRSVRASALDKALSILAADSEVAGIGIRRYATSVPQMGTVTVEAPGVLLKDVAITDNATTGLFVGATTATLRNVDASRNGMLGAAATYADGLRIGRLLAQHNNTEHFNTAPVSGGMKVDRTRGVAIDSSVFSGNDGPGLWADESVYDVVVRGSRMLGNSRHGLSLELSAKAVVVNNIIAGNAGHGLKVNNTSQVQIWNNTFSGNGRAINILQDSRRASDRGTPGHDPRQPFPDPTMSWINGPVTVRNNVIANPRAGADCLLCVEDYSGTYSAEELKITALGNVYHQTVADQPAVIWAQASGRPVLFATPDDFAAETGQERQHLALRGADPLLDGYRPAAVIGGSADAVAQPLPAYLAQLAGQPAGTRSLGAFAAEPDGP